MDDFVSLRDAMSRLLEESFVPEQRTREPGALRLPIDAYATENEIVIITSVPGVNPDDVEITLEDETLTIQGEIAPPLENVDYLMRERPYGRFSRTLRLNVPVEAENAEAEFDNGVLTLTLPKAESVRPKVIKIKKK
jgi:HSP20 family protein